MSGYECRNRRVFSLRWNTSNDGANVTSSGRLFQTLGPAEANERSPTLTSRDGRMSSRLKDADLNRLRDDMSATRCSWSDNRGAGACRERYRRYPRAWAWFAHVHEASEDWPEWLWYDPSDVSQRLTEPQRSGPTGDGCVGRQRCQPTWHYRSPDASAPGKRSSSGKQVAELIVECCAADATRQNSWRQSAGLETSCWGQRQCRCLSLEQ